MEVPALGPPNIAPWAPGSSAGHCGFRVSGLRPLGCRDSVDTAIQVTILQLSWALWVYGDRVEASSWHSGLKAFRLRVRLLVPLDKLLNSSSASSMVVSLPS